ncbi:GRIP and coiled-coil domain-containing protein 2, partial [Cladochytrium tenue]
LEAGSEQQTLRVALAAANAELEELRDSQRQLQEREGRLTQQVLDLSESISPDAEFRKQTEMEALKSEVDTLKQELERAQSELSDARAAAAEWEQKASTAADGQSSFTLEEQMTDYKLQIASRQKELATVTESFQKAQGLLGQASKSLQESKRLQSEKEGEISNLKMSLEELKQTTTDSSTLIKESQATIERLVKELEEVKDLRAIQTAELERKAKDATTELSSVKTEFQSYRVRALAALQKNSSSAQDSRLIDLEETVKLLELEKSQLARAAQEAKARSSQIEAELQSALDQLVALEGRSKQAENSNRDVMLLQQQLESVNKRLSMEQQLAEETLRAKEAQFSSTLDAIRSESKRIVGELDAELAEKKMELESANEQTNKLCAESAQLRTELARTRAEADRAKSVAAAASAAAAAAGITVAGITGPSVDRTQATGGGFFSVPSSPAYRISRSSSDVGRGFAAAGIGSDGGSGVSSPRASISGQRPPLPLVAESFAELLGRGPSVDEPSAAGLLAADLKEKSMVLQYEHVSEQLAQAEERLRRLTQSESLLREQIREFERKERREDMLAKRQNLEYLKNVMLSFLETPAKEPLVPVIAKVLELSPEETKRLQQASAATPDDRTRSIIPSFGLF